VRICESVFEISKEFLKKDSIVFINEKGIEDTSILMLNKGVKKFPIKEITRDHIYQAVVQEFVGCAINYCYWYGISDVRPNQASSGKMYSLVGEAFCDYQQGDNFEICIDRLIQYLAIKRFPLLEEREKHLKELITDGEDFCIDISNAIFYKDKPDYYSFFVDMIRSFPGYASDIFLKRASLFFIQMYRQYNWFKSAMKELPVPADYHVPNMLQGFKCIGYTPYLISLISNQILIPKGSKEECFIRAATIIACKQLQEKTEWNVADIDGWLWLRRKEISDPFHLTITTDY
jgi:hypothetical protein